MRIYYFNSEHEPGKHAIAIVWSPIFGLTLPEDDPNTTINAPYSVIELDEKYNRLLAKNLLYNRLDDHPLSMTARYYVDNAGNIRDNSDDSLVPINPNPEKESYKLSALYGMSQAQLETYIDTNVTTLAEAKEFLKKHAAVTLWLVKQSGLDE